MNKKFKRLANGDLAVKVIETNNIELPVDGKKEVVGTFEQKTDQLIKKPKIKVLKGFIEDELKKAQNQLDELNAKLKPIKDVQDIPDELIQGCLKALDKGNKKFKSEMAVLNQTIQNIMLKKNIVTRIDYVEKQHKSIKEDLDALNKALK